MEHILTRRTAAFPGISKGNIQIGSNANLIVLTEKMIPVHVIGKEQALLENNKLIVQGTFE